MSQMLNDMLEEASGKKKYSPEEICDFLRTVAQKSVRELYREDRFTGAVCETVESLWNFPKGMALQMSFEELLLLASEDKDMAKTRGVDYRAWFITRCQTALSTLFAAARTNADVRVLLSLPAWDCLDAIRLLSDDPLYRKRIERSLRHLKEKLQKDFNMTPKNDRDVTLVRFLNNLYSFMYNCAYYSDAVNASEILNMMIFRTILQVQRARRRAIDEDEIRRAIVREYRRPNAYSNTNTVNGGRS